LNTLNLTSDAQPTAPAQTVTLLTFKVAEQMYGLTVTNVARIIEMVTITHLPNAPETIQGIINVQGKAVPVMDLRQRFGLPPQPYHLHTPIILTDAGDNGRMLGLVVDTVEDVLEVPPANMELTEIFVPAEIVGAMATQAGHLAGVAKINRQMVLVLNARALLSQTEQVKLSTVFGSDAKLYNKNDNHK
jgi:purine-binding chemotaxis protein CheW